MKLFTNEVKIALVAIVAIVVLFFGLQYLKGLTMFSTDDHYFARFNDVSGLSASSPVYANGYRVGVVEGIQYDYADPNNIVAVMSINPKLQLPKGTKAEISSDLLGNVKLELKFGPNPIDVLAMGDTILGSVNKGMMGKAGDMIPQVQTLLFRLDSILSGVNMLISDPALAHALHNVDDITVHLNATSSQLQLLTTSLNKQMPQIIEKTNGVLTNTEVLTKQLSDIDVASTMQKVDATLAHVEQMTNSLNSKEGSLGLLMHDPGLYNNLNATMHDADQLLIDLKAHPKRYVHFSVFGKKDK